MVKIIHVIQSCLVDYDEVGQIVVLEMDSSKAFPHIVPEHLSRKFVDGLWATGPCSVHHDGHVFFFLYLKILSLQIHPERIVLYLELALSGDYEILILGVFRSQPFDLVAFSPCGQEFAEECRLGYLLGILLQFLNSPCIAVHRACEHDVY